MDQKSNKQRKLKKKIKFTNGDDYRLGTKKQGY